MSRRSATRPSISGTILVEIMVGVALIGTYLVSIAGVENGTHPQLIAAASAGENMILNVLAMLGDLDSEELSKLLKASPEAGAGFRDVPLAKFPLAKPEGADDVWSGKGSPLAALDEMKAHLYVRLDRHASGQFGLDRFDVKISFQTAGKTVWLARTLLRRNQPHLVALGSIRLAKGHLDTLSDQDFREALETSAWLQTDTEGRGTLSGSPFPIPPYPSLLSQFEGPVTDSAVLEERKSRRDAFGENLMPASFFFIDPGEAPKPDFGSSTAICN